MDELSLILVHKVERRVIQIGFQNDTDFQFALEGEITFNGQEPIQLTGKLLPCSKAVLGELPFDRINDYPHFEMKLERHSVKGPVENFESKVKPKPRHFIKLTPLKEWNNLPGRSYVVWQKSGTPDRLSDLAVSVYPPIPSTKSRSNRKSGVIRDLSELAVFNRELDLHADQLFDDPKQVSAELIFKRQIKTFQWFMDKARSMNIDRVFIIHGVGSGRLKKEISVLLEHDPAVASYTNEHHPKYGFGATEVVFN